MLPIKIPYYMNADNTNISLMLTILYKHYLAAAHSSGMRWGANGASGMRMVPNIC